MSEWEGEEGNVALKFFSGEGGEGAGRRIKFVMRVEREGGITLNCTIYPSRGICTTFLLEMFAVYTG